MSDLLASAVEHHRQGRLKQAEALYRQALKADPGNADAVHLLGMLAHQSGHDAEAARLIRQAIAGNPGKDLYHFNLGVVLAAAGDHEGAEAAYRAALALRPGDADAHNNLGLSLEAQGAHEAAAACFRHASERNPRHVEAWINLGRSLLTQDEPADAMAHFKRALKLDPKCPEAHFGLGKSLETRDKPEDSEAAYRAALALRPDYPEALNNLGALLLARDACAEARDLLSKAVAIDPSPALYHGNLGHALMRLERPEEAVQAFQAALERDPGFLAALRQRGEAYLALQLPVQAEQDFRAALARQPDDPDMLNSLAAALGRQNRTAEAAEAFREGHRLHPPDPMFLVNLAGELERSNDLEGAEAAARQALELGSDTAALHGVLARLDYRAGRLSEAKARLDHVLTLPLSEAEKVDVLFERGHVLDRLDERPEAFRTFAEANRLQSESPQAVRAEPDRLLQRARASRDWFTKDRLRAFARRAPPPAESPPVFFVGFPRSGTTLMERAIQAHPEAVTTEERSPLGRLRQHLEPAGPYPAFLETLGPQEIEDARAWFWREAEKILGPLEGRRLVDKMPLNLVDLGFANALFPEARAVVAIRDPRDVCLSCYMQLFKVSNSMANFLDLERTARTYAALMDLWLAYRESLTIAWHEYRYEDLVEDFEGVVREVLAVIGLDWHEEVARYREKSQSQVIHTPSYRQVTQALTTRAIGRWRGYREELAPVLPVLAPYVEAFGYPED